MKATLPRAEQRDNRYDPLGDAIRAAVGQIKGATFFVVFGSEGDREEPTITLEVVPI